VTGPTLGKVQPPRGAVPVDFGGQLGGQSVDHRGAHAVQAARRPVGAGAEFAAGVKLGEHHFKRSATVGLLTDGDASSVVGHLNRPVTMDRDLDQVGVTRSRLVDGIVDQFPHQVMQPRRTSASDVHAWPLANRIEAFQDLDMRGVVAGWGLGGGHGRQGSPGS